MATHMDSKQTAPLVDTKSPIYPGDSKSNHDQSSTTDEMLARQMQADWNKADFDHVDMTASKKSDPVPPKVVSTVPGYARVSNKYATHKNQVTIAADLRAITEVSHRR